LKFKYIENKTVTFFVTS